MSAHLAIVYGKAGSGKTTACIEIAKNLISEGSNALFMVPEQYSLEMEKRIVENFGAGFSPKVDVLTFERLPSQIFSRFGPIGQKNFNKTAKQMLLQKVFLQNAKKLTIFQKSIDMPDFLDNTLALFDEFERHLITPETLRENIPGNKIAALKFADIILLYREFQKKCEKDKSVSLPERFDFLSEHGINPFSNTFVFLDQFTSFTPSEYEVINRLMHLSKGIYCTLTTDNLKEKPGLDVFAESKLTAHRLLELAVSEKIEVQPNTYLENERKYKDEDVTIFTASNPYEEVKFIAEEIRNLCGSGINQNEIAIIAENSELYGGLISQIFPIYGIDCFVDVAKSALLDAEIQSTISLFSIFANKFSTYYVLKYLKSCAADIDKMDLDLLENYCLAAGVNPNQWLGKSKIKFVPRGFTSEDVANIQDIIDEQMEELRNLKIEGRKTVDQIINVFSGAIPQNDIANEVLNQMDELIGEEYITFEKFVSIFRAGLSGVELTSLPQNKGQALFCGIDRYKGHNPKILFILGTHDGEFPKRHAAEGIISDLERDELRGRGIIMSGSSRTKQLYEQQTVYFCTHSPSEKLYLTHSLFGFDGIEITPSIVLDQIKSGHTNCNLKNNLYHSLGESCLDVPPTNLPKNPISPAAHKLYESKSSTSISQVERFSLCPYSYFLQYGIHAQKRTVNTIGTPDVGTIIHSCIEKFSKLGDFDNFDIIPNLVEETVNDIFSENITENPRFASSKQKITETLNITLKAIAEFYKETNFAPLSFEMELPETIIKVNENRQIKLIGRADRIDVAEEGNENYINIIDYKTYDENIDYTDLLAGVQIQLPVYIKTICDYLSKSENKTYLPANMLYFYVHTPNAEEGEASQLQKQLRMKGLILANEMIDNKFAVISNKSKVSLEHIQKICEDAFSIVQKQLKRMLEGDISLTPYKNGEKLACNFCDYAEVCRFDARKEGNNYNYGKKMDSESATGNN